jgi:hypothetical protein
MVKWVCVVALCVSLAGCGFMQDFQKGFSGSALEQVRDVAVEAVDAKYGDKFDDIEDALADIPLTPPKKEDESGLGYVLGALVAYVIGSVAKGKIREWKAEKPPTA